MTYVRLMDRVTSGINLENSTLSQRSWTKLGQEFAQEGQHTRYGQRLEGRSILHKLLINFDSVYGQP